MAMIERKHADLGSGALLVGAGLALALGLPPNWWPEMPTYLVHAGLTIAVLFLVLGVILLFVGWCETRSAGWPQRLAEHWYGLLSGHWHLLAVCGLLLVALIPFIVGSIENSRLAGIRVGFHFEHPKSLDNGSISFDYLLSNDRDYIRLEKIRIAEVLTNSIPEFPIREFDFCTSEALGQFWNIDERVQEVETAPIRGTLGNRELSVHAPTNIKINGESGGSVVVQRGAPLAVSVQASLFNNDWSKYNSLVVCPILEFYDSTLGESVMSCPGALLVHFSAGQATVWRSSMPPKAEFTAVDHTNGLSELWAWKSGPFFLRKRGDRAVCTQGIP